MRLYFNGCSHTYGDDLIDPKQNSWPSLVAKEKNCNFVNFAMSGGTNDRIKYQTVKYLDEFDKFYIAWTYTSRFTRYRSDNNHDVNFNVQFKHAIYGNDPEFQDYARIHYRVWHNELFAFKLWLQDIILIQQFFESNRKPYLMINADNNFINRWTIDWINFNNSVKSLLCFDNMNDTQLFLEHKEIQTLVKKINFEFYPGWNDWWISKLISEYPTGSTGHLLEEGHRAVADYILKHDTN